MKTKKKNAIRELRKIIGGTQAQFAVMIGASKDTVVSWEAERNRLSAQFARRIAFATGLEAEELLRGRLMSYVPFSGRGSFTAERFKRHRASYWGLTGEAAARQHLRYCEDALKLIFLAAAKRENRLPAALDSLIQWCEGTRREFQLERPIDELLAQRKAKLVLTHMYRQWRQMAKEDPSACRALRFKDDPRKGDNESLTLEMDTIPIWRPGFPMRGRG